MFMDGLFCKNHGKWVFVGESENKFERCYCVLYLHTMKEAEKKKKKLLRFSICVPEDVVKVIDKKADDEKRSRSQMLTVMALAYEKK